MMQTQLPQTFKGAGQSIFRGGGYTDFKGLQPMIDEHKYKRMLEIFTTPKFKELAAFNCRIYYQLLFREKNKAGVGLVQGINDRIEKILELHKDKDNPANIEKARAEIEPLNLAIKSFGSFVQEMKKRTEDEARKIDYKTPKDVETDILAEDALIVSINHYLNNATNTPKVILYCAAKIAKDESKAGVFPFSEDHIEKIRGFQSRFSKDAEFLKNAAPEQIFGQPYLDGKGIPMICFPSDPEYKKPAA